MTESDTDLADRKVILLRDIVRSQTLPMNGRTLRRTMRDHGIPIVRLSARKSAMLMADLDRLIEQSKIREEQTL